MPTKGTAVRVCSEKKYKLLNVLKSYLENIYNEVIFSEKKPLQTELQRTPPRTLFGISLNVLTQLFSETTAIIINLK